MRKFFCLAFCYILVVAAPGLLLASHKTVKVGIYQNKPKVFINSAGEPEGFFIDILNYIASKEGWQLDYEAATWEENLEKLEKAEIDLLLDIAKSEERAESFDFNKEIIFSNWAIVYVQEDSKIQSILKTVHNGDNTVFVEKPYRLKELLRTIREIMDRHP
jgi:ABC-type amino acid transport substrate-binding protein